MADKTKQYEDLKREIEWKIKLYKYDLKEVEDFIYFKENLIVYDEDSPLLKVAKYFIRYELESEVIKKLKNTPIFLDEDGNYRKTTKEDIKKLIEYMATDTFLFRFSEKGRQKIYEELPLTPYLYILEGDKTEKIREEEERERKERELRFDKFNKEFEEFQTISKMLKFILDCQKRKSSPKSKKIPLKIY